MARMTANRRFIVPRFLRRAICKRIALLLGVVLAANATSLPIPAHAQDATLSSTYITPSPRMIPTVCRSTATALPRV